MHDQDFDQDNEREDDELIYEQATEDDLIEYPSPSDQENTVETTETNIDDEASFSVNDSLSGFTIDEDKEEADASTLPDEDIDQAQQALDRSLEESLDVKNDGEDDAGAFQEGERKPIEPDGKNDDEPDIYRPKTTSIRTEYGTINAQKVENNILVDIDAVSFDLDCYPVAPDIRNRIEYVYIGTEGFESTRTKIIHHNQAADPDDQQRIVIIHGKPFSGKFATAVRLGIELQQERAPNIYTLGFRAQRAISVFEVLRHENFPKRSVLIVENAFELGIETRELSTQYLPQINEILSKIDSYLVLLTEIAPEDLAHIRTEKIFLSPSEETSEAKIVDLSLEQMELVFKRHIDRYQNGFEIVMMDEALGSKAMQCWTSQENTIQLKDVLISPSYVDLFCYQLSSVDLYQGELTDQNQEEQKLIEVIEKTALQISRIGKESPGAWFASLVVDKQFENYRLYALLAGIFEGIPRYQLDEIYVFGVKALRQEGLDDILADPRRFGMIEMLNRIQLEWQDNGLVKFRVHRFRDEVLRQLPNYHHLLWSIVETWLNEIAPILGTFSPEFRRSLGLAIGKLGIYHKAKLLFVIERLIARDQSTVRVIAGYILEGICSSGVEYYALALEFLEEWLDSEHPYKMWTVGASIERIYPMIYDNTDGQSSTQFVAQEALSRVHHIYSNLAGRFHKIDTFLKYARRTIAQLGALGVMEEVAKRRDLDLKEMAQTMPDFDKLENLLIDSIQKSSGKQIDEIVSNIQEEALALVARSVVHAAIQLVQINPHGMVRILQVWLAKIDANTADETKYDIEDVNRLFVATLIIRDVFQRSSNDPRIYEGQYRPLLDLVGSVIAIGERQTIELMMHTLRNWVEFEDWDEYVLTTLLYETNRLKNDERKRLLHVLHEQWIESSSDKALDIARQIIMRARLLEGIPCALPTILRGYVVIDGGFGAETRQIINMGRRFYYNLNAQLDTHIVHLGRHETAIPPHLEIRSTDLYTPIDTLPLFAPVMRLCENQPETIGLILVLTNSAIIDIDDLSVYFDHASETETATDSTVSWIDQIVISDLGKKTRQSVLGVFESADKKLNLISGVIEKHEFDETRWERSLKVLTIRAKDVQYFTPQSLEYALNQTLSKRLLQPDILKSISVRIGDQVPLNGELGVEDVWKWIMSIIPTLDDIKTISYPDERMRAISCATLFISVQDFDNCTTMLKELMESKDALEVSVGLSCSKLLLNVYMARSVPVETHSSIFQLGPLLAQHDDWDGVKHVLWLIRNWVRYPQWDSRFKYLGGELSNIPLMLDNLSANRKNQVRDILTRAWSNPIRALGEVEIPQQAKSLATQLINRIESGGPRRIPEISEKQKYALIILDTSRDPESLQVTKLSADLIQSVELLVRELQASRADKLCTLIYHVGVSTPLWVCGDDSNGGTISLPPYVPPRLLQPMLNLFNTDHVAYLLYFTNMQAPPVDFPDWIANWRPYLTIFTSAGKKDLSRAHAWIRSFPYEEIRKGSLQAFISNSMKGT